MEYAIWQMCAILFAAMLEIVIYWRHVVADYYEMKVKGHLDRGWSDWFSGLKIDYLPGDVTLIHGRLPDQTALHGLLERIRDLNLVIESVMRVERPSDDAANCQTAEGDLS
jgi:hypothetical protein